MRRPTVAVYAAFFASTSLALWIPLSLRVPKLGAAPLVHGILVFIAGVVAVIGLREMKERAAAATLGALMLGALLLTVVARFIWTTERASAAATIATAVALVAVLVVFRARPVVFSSVSVHAYGAFVLGASALAGVVTGSAVIGVSTLVVLVVLLGVGNYSVQLALEHREVIRAVWDAVKSEQGAAILARSALLVLPVLALVIIGLVAYTEIEHSLRTSLYIDVGVIYRDLDLTPDLGHGAVGGFC